MTTYITRQHKTIKDQTTHEKVRLHKPKTTRQSQATQRQEHGQGQRQSQRQRQRQRHTKTKTKTQRTLRYTKTFDGCFEMHSSQRGVTDTIPNHFRLFGCSRTSFLLTFLYRPSLLVTSWLHDDDVIKVVKDPFSEPFFFILCLFLFSIQSTIQFLGGNYFVVRNSFLPQETLDI